MAEISYNPDVEQIIRGNLAATKRWEWAEDDRKWAAIGAAISYFRDHSTMSEMLALGLAEKITTEIMREESQEPTMVECPWCGQMHYSDQMDFCPRRPKQPPK